MAKLDADGDGKITLEEFRELFKHKQNRKSPKEIVHQCEEFFVSNSSLLDECARETKP